MRTSASSGSTGFCDAQIAREVVFPEWRQVPDGECIGEELTYIQEHAYSEKHKTQRDECTDQELDGGNGGGWQGAHVWVAP